MQPSKADQATWEGPSATSLKICILQVLMDVYRKGLPYEQLGNFEYYRGFWALTFAPVSTEFCGCSPSFLSLPPSCSPSLFLQTVPRGSSCWGLEGVQTCPGSGKQRESPPPPRCQVIGKADRGSGATGWEDLPQKVGTVLQHW